MVELIWDSSYLRQKDDLSPKLESWRPACAIPVTLSKQINPREMSGFSEALSAKISRSHLLPYKRKVRMGAGSRTSKEGGNWMWSSYCTQSPWGEPQYSMLVPSFDRLYVELWKKTSEFIRAEFLFINEQESVNPRSPAHKDASHDKCGSVEATHRQMWVP